MSRPRLGLGGVFNAAISWIRDPPSNLDGLPPLASWDRRLATILPLVFAISTGIQITRYITIPEWIGFDASLYAAAAGAWLSGADPWSVSSNGIPFGAPPPTLLPFVPFAWMPGSLVALLWIVGSFAAAMLAIRALGLRWWWIAFWPIVDGCLVGNPNIAVLALLVISKQRFASLSPILKIYAAIPLMAERRWKSIAISGVILLVTFAFLPWSTWFASLPAISSSLDRFADTTSVAGNVPLMAIGLLALASLGLRRAGWLFVPVLWPWTQTHYLAISVPVLTPTIAILWSVPGLPPSAVLGSVILAAVGFRFFPSADPASESEATHGMQRLRMSFLDRHTKQTS